MNKVEDFVKRANKHLKSDVMSVVSQSKNTSPRFSSGILDLDLAMGGGFPFSRIILLYGVKSAGKSTIFQKACASIQNLCKHCKKNPCQCESGETEYGNALIVDSEGTFDREWAQSLGMNPDQHVLFTPEYGEQAVDVIDQALDENIFDLIVLDSIAQLNTAAEIENSAGDGSPGGNAKMMNKAFRKWVNKYATRKEIKAPMICINQNREKYITMGDNTTLPHGKGQWFSNSIEIKMNTPKYYDVASVGSNVAVVMKGNIPKNKTYVPKQEFSFALALKDHGLYTKGDVMNIDSVVRHAKAQGWVTAGGGKWKIKGREKEISCNGKEELFQLLYDKPDLYNWCYRRVLENEIGELTW